MDLEKNVQQLKDAVADTNKKVAVLTERVKWVLWINSVLLGLTGLDKFVPAAAHALGLK